MKLRTGLLLAVLLFPVSVVPAAAQSAVSFFQEETSRLRLTPLNFFLFWLPPLAWNLVFSERLSLSHFGEKLPGWYEPMEWALRIGTLVYPLLLPIDMNRDLFYPGLAVYSAGMLLYFASWLPYIYAPDSTAAQLPVLQFAPAYLPAVWLLGMAMMSGSWVFAGISLTFVTVHVGEYVIRYTPGR